MRFSTFSTGFSTTKGHQPYTHRNSGRSFLVSFGQKCGHSAFYKKESRRIFFAFYKPFPSGDLFFSNLEWLPPSFQHRAAAVFPCGKGGENCSFPHCFFRPNPLSRLRRQLPRRGSLFAVNRQMLKSSPFGGAGCDQREQTERVGCKKCRAVTSRLSGIALFFTSYCGIPAVRSGNTGSGCRRPRWW